MPENLLHSFTVENRWWNGSDLGTSDGPYETDTCNCRWVVCTEKSTDVKKVCKHHQLVLYQSFENYFSVTTNITSQDTLYGLLLCCSVWKIIILQSFNPTQNSKFENTADVIFLEPRSVHEYFLTVALRVLEERKNWRGW